MSAAALLLILVTACNSGKYFKRLRNLVGSVHYWEPDLQVVVYDLVRICLSCFDECLVAVLLFFS